MNYVDIAFGALIVLFTIRGLIRGVIRELAGFIGIVLGFFVASRYYPQVMQYLKPYVGDQAILTVVSYLAVFMAVLIIVTIIAVAFEKFMSVTFTAWLNHALGGVTGLTKALLICSVALTLLARFSGDSSFIKTSMLAPYIEQVTAFGKQFLPPSLWQ